MVEPHRHKDFRCPKCGGWAFGSRSRHYEIIEYECHSYVDGDPIQATPDKVVARKQAGRTFEECGWRGKKEECFKHGM